MDYADSDKVLSPIFPGNLSKIQPESSVRGEHKQHVRLRFVDMVISLRSLRLVRFIFIANIG